MPRNATTAPRPRYMTLQEAAIDTGFTVKTLRRWISDGRLPAYRFGGRVIRVRPEDVDALARPIPTATV
ncbi:excisionase family DNA-binding protein [Arsenicicoccus dermatophilus]|uniref:excisionase family DNA-binding protein n=1 Tax=Arsenicicoccus dermatophilus TaxID=1076331 RepID=UPI0039171DBF